MIFINKAMWLKLCAYVVVWVCLSGRRVIIGYVKNLAIVCRLSFFRKKREDAEGEKLLKVYRTK
jgi:hypothetical protein